MLFMEAKWIHPFLHSACTVIEQVVQVRPERGEMEMTVWSGDHDLLVKIELTGQLSLDIAFGLSEEVAVKMASAMMGGYPLESLDMMGESAISELSNMISGNASTLLYNEGIIVDITPPQLFRSEALGQDSAMAVPLHLEHIGRFDVLVRVG
ncbi:chemotaxis protein CheX [Paenibacillus aquistagni]|uniref:Chemotaxis protein CheX n=2 Tax=Paenibacillus aquistagni TaxID=1852522 RepID=A0A1X7LSW0_9BACL|nr:chemotaxis protein CheX [Paenibacillus aquistagni]